MEHEFYVKCPKCLFSATTLEYLGHLISTRGVEMETKKISAVLACLKYVRKLMRFDFLIEYKAGVTNLVTNDLLRMYEDEEKHDVNATKINDAPDVNLLKEDVGTVLLWVKLHGVPITAFSEDGLSFIATKLGTSLMLDSYTSDMCMQSWGRSSYARAMIELRANVELKDNIMATISKITRKGYYTCNIRVAYERKPPSVHVTSQTPKGIPVGQKVGFKPTKQVYQPVSKKTTSNTSVYKKKNIEPTKEVCNSNPFEVLTSIENDVELGTNGGISNLASQATNSSGSSFWNVDASSPSTTPIIEKINKIEKLIMEKLLWWMMKSLLEQWMEAYENDDYEYNPYDDDMYEGQDIPDKLQAIRDKLDITVRGRRKK
nr:hypothetical protein [Tanacetum cinerariifolium]